MQRIIKNNEVVDETWHLLPKDFNIDEISNCDDLIVPLALWREHSRMLKARDGGLGVWLDADEEAEEIGDDVDQFKVIALNFPAFTDGRNYSNARLLRDRYGFKGTFETITVTQQAGVGVVTAIGEGREIQGNHLELIHVVTDFLGFFIGVQPHTQAAIAGLEHTAVFAPQRQRHDQVVAVADLVDVEVLGQQVPGFVDDFVVLNYSLHRRAP